MATRKTTAACLLAGILLFPQTVYGEETASPSPGTSASASAESSEPELAAYAAALVDEASGTVLYQKNGDGKADPSGLTKMMTVYLAGENLDSSKMLTMSETAFQTYDHSSGVLWIQLGEQLSAESAEYACMLGSYNDAAALLAEAVSGGNEQFVSKMNEEAEEIGMSNTSFDNIFGNYSDGNYTTAEDLALLTRQALKNKDFAKIFASSSYTIPETNMTQSRVIANNFQMLRNTSDFYSTEIKGGMLGYNSTNGYVAVALNDRDGGRLIAAVAGEADENAVYGDIQKLLEYGYSHYQTVKITPQEIGVKTIEVHDARGKHAADVTFQVSSGFEALLPSEINADDLKSEIVVNHEDAQDPDEITAEVVFTLNGEKVGSAQMEKEVKTYDTSFRATTAVTMRKWLDDISIGVLVFILVFPIVVHLAHGLRPPE